MNQTIYQKLKGVANQQELITYQEAALLVGLNMDSPADRDEIAKILDEINIFEAQNGRPMLSAIVVHSTDRTPGGGFYNCARGLGRLATNDKFGELEFWVNEVKRVHQIWSAKKS